MEGVGIIGGVCLKRKNINSNYLSFGRLPLKEKLS